MTSRRTGAVADRIGRRRSLRFAVLQLGARMHYAIPALLKQANMLQHFYTDAVGNMGLTRRLGQVLPNRFCPAALKRLLGRKIPAGVAEDDVTTAQPLALLDGLRRRIDVNAGRFVVHQPTTGSFRRRANGGSGSDLVAPAGSPFSFSASCR